jgi:hypothetical protein
MALRFLWRTHPAANCFVLFSEEEASHLDAMRLVRPGAVIGFRRVGAKSPRISRYCNDVSFGQVTQCDTVSRKWLVQLEGGEGRTIFVQDTQLAGVEDLTKRTSLFAYTPAPSSSTSIETFGPLASIGHLILSLQWCSQFHSEIQRNISPHDSDSMLKMTKRLAEISSAFLGTELSIREESKFPNVRIDDILANQIHHLFEDISDFDGKENTENNLGRREGRLKILLSQVQWKIMQKQVAEHVNAAVVGSVKKGVENSNQ